MKQYLDIPSLIKSNFYKKNKRLLWHTSYEEYQKISIEIHNLFKNLQFNEMENEIFQIIKKDVCISLIQYLTHVLDFKLLSKRNCEPIYSKKSNVYIDNIWKKIPIHNTFQLNHNEGQRRKVNTKIKFFYSKLVKRIPKILFRYIVGSDNKLLREFIVKKKFNYLKILPTYYFPHNFKKNSFSKNLSKKITNKIVSTINEKYFHLSSDQKESINFILEINITNAYNNIEDYSGFLKNTKNLILGSSNNYHDRLISYFANKTDAKIWKFDHGGERCFFNDQLIWETLFINTDYYVSYGHKWANYISRINKQNNNFRTSAISIGSAYHQKLYDNYFNKKTKQTKKILYLPNSFVSEGRQISGSKLIDQTLYDWQKYLLETLKDLNYDVIYKTHPKGYFHNINNLNKITNNKDNQPLVNYFNSVDTIIVDYAGSAFIETLCAGKNIIYIDLKYRSFDKENFVEFNSCVKIVPTYIKNNIIYLDTNELVNALETPNKSIKSQKKVVNDFFLNE
jgi:hypothetical protein